VILYPAIDLKEGRCVRLVRGEMNAATVFNDDPAAQAQSFVDAGCRWLHLVDLDGAFAGKPMNAKSVEAILARVKVPAELGGGIRDLATIEAWLGKGIARVILGTAALTNPDLVKAGCRRFPGKVAVGIDARGGKVAVEGWAKTSEMTALDLALRVEDAGAAAIIFTDIDRDGVLAGVNVAATAALAQKLKTPVIASGGVASLADITALKVHEKDGIAGAILGRALYDGRIDLPAALKVAG
jgi:phosphoribosylformimino-5-aminoimidazole carboxamide ribotide isomerase